MGTQVDVKFIEKKIPLGRRNILERIAKKASVHGTGAAGRGQPAAAASMSLFLGVLGQAGSGRADMGILRFSQFQALLH